MANFTTNVTVDRPVGEVWAKFMSVDAMGKWMKGFQSVETIAGKPETVGSKHRMRFEERGRLIEMIETVTAIRPNEEYAFDTDMPELSGHVSVHFLSRGRSTEIRTDNEFRPKMLLWKMMMPFLKSGMAKRQTTDFLTLKQLIESER